MINVGDFVQMVKANKELAPMEVGSEYIVQEIEYDVATLYSVENEKRYNVSIDILEKHFEKIMPKNDNKHYDDFDSRYNKVLDIMDNAEYAAFKVFDKCTVVACKLPNGFVIVESSACINPDDYDEGIGIEGCLDRIEDKVMMMEAYNHCEELYDDELCEDCCKNCDCCEDCDCDEEDCVYNDLDCDDCDEEDCPFRVSEE